MKVALLVHGFASKGGKGSTDTLRPYFEQAGWLVYELDYGYTMLPTLTRVNKKLALSWVGWARALNQLQKDLSGSGELVGVGHSNGCAILRLASWLGAPFTQLVFINPALNTKGRKTRVGPTVKRVHVWHSSSDKVLQFARFIPWHTWGRMGAIGYKGDDPTYANYDKRRDYSMKSKEHGDVFEQPERDFFGPIIVQEADNAI